MVWDNPAAKLITWNTSARKLEKHHCWDCVLAMTCCNASPETIACFDIVAICVSFLPVVAHAEDICQFHEPWRPLCVQFSSWGLPYIPLVTSACCYHSSKPTTNPKPSRKSIIINWKMFLFLDNAFKKLCIFCYLHVGDEKIKCFLVGIWKIFSFQSLSQTDRCNLSNKNLKVLKIPLFPIRSSTLE